MVLVHIDHEAAARPEESGRPLEMLIDTSDYGWAAPLCQRPEPHKAPKVISILAKAFLDVQLRWSTMERDFMRCGRELLGMSA